MKSLPCLVMLALAVGLASAQPAGLSPSPSPGVSPAPSTANKTTPASPGPTSPAPSLRASPLPSLVANVLRSPSPAAGGGVNRSPAPNGAASAASPAPSLKASPLPKPAADVLRSPAPAASAAAGGMKGSPAAARPAPAAATAPANTTNTKVSGYYSSPLYAIQSIPELTELTKLGAGSEVAKLLSNKQLVSTIFAPNNAAVKRAVEFVQNATGADANSLTRSGVIEQLLSYHVAKGAAILLGNFKDNQTLTMLDGNKTTIVKQEAGGPARRLLQAGNVTYFIVSDSNQTIQLSGPANIQGGKSMIHVIDGVLVPKALLDQYNITNTTDLPGANASATSSRVADTTTSRDISPGATTQAPQKSSAASIFFAAQVAVPALLAALWL